MKFSEENMPAWLPESARAEPKKFGILLILAIVLVIALVRYLLISKSPAVASAGVTTTTLRAPGAPTAVRGAGNNGPTAVKKWIDTPTGKTERNLFVIDPARYPLTSARPSAVAGGGSDLGIWAAVEKLQAEQTDQDNRRATLIDYVRNQAAQLRLQSTVVGREPQALVDGRVVRVGQLVTAADGKTAFCIESINAQSVVVRCESQESRGLRLEIRMRQ